MGPDIFMYDKHLDFYDKNVYIFIRINNHIQKLNFKRKKTIKQKLHKNGKN